MIKSEIEQAAEKYAPGSLLSPSTFQIKKGFIAGAEMVNEKQPYSKEDMRDMFNEGIYFAMHNTNSEGYITGDSDKKFEDLTRTLGG